LTEETLQLSAGARARLDRLGNEFLADVLGIETRERPTNAAALVTLGMVLTQLGRYAEGLAVDRQLVELQPEDSTARYNFACSLALVGEREGALDQLEEAARRGYDDAEHLAADPDLASLRDEPRFQALLESLSAR
jgi:Flp pilus assembly protein TadD